MKHLDLFSGIGGFAYAIDQVWDNVEHVFCDFDPFCKQVLKKHWPEAEIYGDIRQINSNPFNKRLERIEQKETSRQSGQLDPTRQDEESRPFILTGGFPCQPFSAAGLRRGTADERHLWPEMLRVIQLTQPEWVIAENVRGIITWSEGLVFEQVCTDLEAAGYEVQPFIIPAVAVNAPHRRDRVWFVAYNDQRSGRSGNVTITDKKKEQERSPNNSNAEDSHFKRGRGGGKGSRQILERQKPEVKNAGPDWSSHWLEIATELCRLDDGLPAELDGFKLSKSQHRKEQLKSYGNAIVPQVALEIIRSIKYADSGL